MLIGSGAATAIDSETTQAARSVSCRGRDATVNLDLVHDEHVRDGDGARLAHLARGIDLLAAA